MAGLAVLHHPVTRRHAVVDTERFHFSLDAGPSPFGAKPGGDRTHLLRGIQGQLRLFNTIAVLIQDGQDLGVDLSPFIQADRSISGLLGSPPSPETQNQVETRLKGLSFPAHRSAGKGCRLVTGDQSI